MNFPKPTERQAQVLWLALTALAWAVLLGIAGLFIWGTAVIINRLSSVLLPLAIACILAYLLDPVVDFMERKRIPRMRAIILVFFLGIMTSLMLLSMVVPMLVVEIGDLAQNMPDYIDKLRYKMSLWMAKSHLGLKAREVWESQFGETAQTWLTEALPAVSGWMLAQVSRVASWAGLLIGLALVPVYLFYFLLEKQGITKNWADYLPLRESKIKHEVVFVLAAINDCLIVFFRGQILVALCDGLLLMLGFWLINLNYAVLLGLVAGLLSLVPYLGLTISLIPALALAAVQHGDWLHPMLVLAVFAIAQTLEGMVIAPKILGDRVGLHPLTIIVSVMVGTTLLGGIIGGLLAIPLTAALRTLMFRYVWKKRTINA